MSLFIPNIAVLGYWDIRGLAEPIRLMLEYCAFPYESMRYVCGDAPDYSRSVWTYKKHSLGLDFPNLPYYIDGDTKLTESFAIMKHIARKSKKLIPKTDLEADRCDMLQGVVSDFRRDFTGMCYRPEFETNKAAFFDNTFPQKIEKINEYLGGKTYIAGDTLTYVDFALAEILDHLRLMSPDCFSKFDNVTDYLDRFFKLERIAAYRESSRFKKFPINNKMAHWGGKAE